MGYHVTSSIRPQRLRASSVALMLALSTLLVTSVQAADGCAEIKGTWKQTHLSLVLDENVIADASASWTFASDGNVTYHSEFGNMKFKFDCRDNVIHMHAPIPSTMKIVRNEGAKMVWTPSMGGFIYVAR